MTCYEINSGKLQLWHIFNMWFICGGSTKPYVQYLWFCSFTKAPQNEYTCFRKKKAHTLCPIITGSKCPSRLNSAMVTVMENFNNVTHVRRVGMYSSSAATSSRLGKVLHSSSEAEEKV